MSISATGLTAKHSCAVRYGVLKLVPSGAFSATAVIGRASAVLIEAILRTRA